MYQLMKDDLPTSVERISHPVRTSSIEIQEHHATLLPTCQESSYSNIKCPVTTAVCGCTTAMYLPAEWLPTIITLQEENTNGNVADW